MISKKHFAARQPRASAAEAAADAADAAQDPTGRLAERARRRRRRRTEERVGNGGKVSCRSRTCLYSLTLPYPKMSGKHITRWS